MEKLHATSLEPNLSEHRLTLVICPPYYVPLETIRSPQTLRQMLFVAKLKEVMCSSVVSIHLNACYRLEVLENHWGEHIIKDLWL